MLIFRNPFVLDRACMIDEIGAYLAKTSFVYGWTDH
jgi:hypothetical protein